MIGSLQRIIASQTMVVPELANLFATFVPNNSFGNEELLTNLGLGEEDLAFGKLGLELLESLFSIYVTPKG